MSRANNESRRSFLKKASLAGLGASLVNGTASAERSSAQPVPGGGAAQGPVVVSSGNGRQAAQRAIEMMQNGSTALDAAIAGVNLVEEDPEDITVGYGGIPNENGVVQLDAAVMDGPTHRAGSVAALEGIKYPSRVARLVMERTDHVLLTGQGAQDFATMHGFPIENLLTERAREIWVEWKETLSTDDDYLPPHDMDDTNLGAIMQDVTRHYGTIHCSALDPNGNLGSVTTTSGLFFKIPGRVGDSPIIGAGLYCDNEVGAAGSTGRGEANLQNLSSYLIVERMRAGDTPEEACLFACRRIAENTTVPRLLNDQGEPNFGVRFYAVRKDGKFGGAQMRGTGQMIVGDANGVRLVDIPGLFEENE
jgi:N4-(beta-N-acetylglucosaminyl)-L-asparaginase